MVEQNIKIAVIGPGYVGLPLAIHLTPTSGPERLSEADFMIVAVPHLQYRKKSVDAFTAKLLDNGCIADVKSMLDNQEVEKRGVDFWRL